jgi:hypothetical protein
LFTSPLISATRIRRPIIGQPIADWVRLLNKAANFFRETEKHHPRKGLITAHRGELRQRSSVTHEAQPDVPEKTTRWRQASFG